MLKRLGFITALVAAGALLAGCLVRGKTLEFLDQVEVRVDGVGVQGLALTGATLVVHTRVVNRSDVGFSFQGMDYRVYYQGRLVGSGRDDAYHTIHPRAEDTFDFPVAASYGDAVATFLTLGQKAPCLVKGKATTVSFAGKHDIDFAVETTFGGQ